MASARGPLGLGLLMLLLGIALLAWAISSGNAEVYLVAIIPVITGTGALFAGGALLTMAGLVVTFLGMSMRAVEGVVLAGDAQPGPADGPDPPPRESATPAGGGAQFGGVVFIGPIPIVFGKGPGAGRWMLVASIVFAVLLIVFILGLLL